MLSVYPDIISGPVIFIFQTPQLPESYSEVVSPLISAKDSSENSLCKTSDSNVTLLPLWLWPQSEWLQMYSNLPGLPWSSVRRPSDLTSCSSVLAPCALAMPAVFAITSGSAFNMRPSTPSFCSWPSYFKLQLQSHTPASVPCPPNTSSFCLFGLIYLFTIEIASSSVLAVLPILLSQHLSGMLGVCTPLRVARVLIDHRVWSFPLGSHSIREVFLCFVDWLFQSPRLLHCM